MRTVLIVTVVIACVAAIAVGGVRMGQGARDIAATTTFSESERARRGGNRLARGGALLLLGLGGLGFLLAFTR